jgi:nitrogen regulatory protein PII
MAKKRNITILTDVVLITCIVQKGLGDTIVKAAMEVGAQGATTYFAHGSGVRERLGIFGVAVEAEKEVVNIIVSDEQSNQVFDAMYLAGQLDTPGKGFIYMTDLNKAATYIPLEVIEKLSSENGN